MKTKLIIAIDGPGGAGKTTVAKRIAEELNYIHIDSGAMYRAVTWKVLNESIDPQDKNKVVKLCHRINISLKQVDNQLKIYVDGEDVSVLIRTPFVTRNVAPIADNVGVRACLVDQQRRLSKDGGIVMDGRDIGTVVFPDADLKIYLDASLEERTKRRYNELIQIADNVSFDLIYEDTKTRDIRDKSRPVGALIKDKDAQYIDSTRLSIDEVVSNILGLVHSIASK